MKRQTRVSFPSKVLSNLYYLQEVPVEGKVTNRFFHKIGYYDLYAAQVIRTGNCLTLLSNAFTLSVDTFWNISYFENTCSYIFWTFNKGFKLKLIQQMKLFPEPTLQCILALLKGNFVPFDASKSTEGDEELTWCHVKNDMLKKSGKFELMYRLDEKNRLEIREALESRLRNPEADKNPHPRELSLQIGQTNLETSFLEMLRPMHGSSQETLNFIHQKTEEAAFGCNLFRPISKLENGKNPYGLNGRMAAMIEFFYQADFFKKEYTLEQIFTAYLTFSGNTIGKFRTFLSEFRNDNSFIKYYGRLKELKINQLP